ncbi:MAG: stage II sporulation protein M [Chloroflexi bacterium]|nr:stage II sporulation protein M [Chloroflexota bacterium]
MKQALSFWSISLTVLLFAGSVYLGYQSADSEVARLLSRDLRASLSPLRDLGAFPLLVIIFLNNSIKALMVIVLGIIPFIFSSGFVVLNGFIIGIVVEQAVAARGLGFTLLGLLPHGLLELAAILLSAALGLQIGFAVLAALGGKKAFLGQRYKNSLMLYLKFVLPALLVAAIIETIVGRYILPGG